MIKYQVLDLISRCFIYVHLTLKHSLACHALLYRKTSDIYRTLQQGKTKRKYLTERKKDKYS